MEILSEVKGEPFRDVYVTMLKRVFVWSSSTADKVQPMESNLTKSLIGSSEPGSHSFRVRM